VTCPGDAMPVYQVEMIISALLGAGWAFSSQTRSVARPIEVAFIAEIYRKRGDYDHSRPRVYICGLHGENRRAIPGVANMEGIAWKDADHLVWFARANPDFGDADLKLIYSLKTGKTTITHLKANQSADDVPLSNEQKFSDKIAVSSDPSHPGTFQMGDDDNRWKLKRDGHTKTVDFGDGEPRGILSDEAHNCVWFYDWGHVSSGGTWQSLYRLEWSTGKIQKVFDNACDFDFSPRRDLYATVDNFHLPPNAKVRWPKFAKAWVGNWVTGRKWPVLEGETFATSIALRPQ